MSVIYKLQLSDAAPERSAQLLSRCQRQRCAPVFGELSRLIRSFKNERAIAAARWRHLHHRGCLSLGAQMFCTRNVEVCVCGTFWKGGDRTSKCPLGLLSHPVAHL